MAGEDRVVLVTGASTGIGEAIARGAAAGGHRVVLAARSADRIAAVADELGAPERALAVPCDVTEWDQVEALAAAAVEAFGGIDVVVANAGFGAKRGFTAESPEHWRSMVLTNVYGAAITVRATLEQLRERRGHLFLMGSIAGHKVPPGSVYGATKWAVTGMAEAARQELNGTGVRVTLISPGTVETPFYDEPVGGEQLTADDVARAVLFAMAQPPHVDVNEIMIRPTVQDF
jgi:NADP-dependent 3-hydroxy acid dehydrogenase YdfG